MHTVKLPNQHWRNLTTGILHTKFSDIQTDLETLTGTPVGTISAIFVCEAILPTLREKLTDPRFWNDTFDTTHTGETEISL